MVTIVTRPFLDRFISEAGFASDETRFASEWRHAWFVLGNRDSFLSNTTNVAWGSHRWAKPRVPWSAALVGSVAAALPVCQGRPGLPRSRPAPGSSSWVADESPAHPRLAARGKVSTR